MHKLHIQSDTDNERGKNGNPCQQIKSLFSNLTQPHTNSCLKIELCLLCFTTHFTFKVTQRTEEQRGIIVKRKNLLTEGQQYSFYKILLTVFSFSDLSLYLNNNKNNNRGFICQVMRFTEE